MDLAEKSDLKPLGERLEKIEQLIKNVESKRSVPRQYLSLKELEIYLNISEWKIRQYLRRAENPLPSVRLGDYRFFVPDVDKWVKDEQNRIQLAGTTKAA